jgi:LacI family gluconate utilization system Gnt-I transcriptional repressor
MTASRVLRGEGGYSEKTRVKVMEQVDVLGYLPNRLATVFAGDQSSTFIGVSIPDLGNEVFAQVLEGIDRKLGTFGYQSVLGLTQHTLEEEENWIRTVLSWQPAGLILTGRYHSPRASDMLRNAGIPVVEIWDLNSSPLDMSVGINHFDSGFDMGRYLTYYPGFYGSEQLLGSARDIECIFYQNDAMAFGGLQYCAAKGLSVPDDIGIAGWGGLPIASVMNRRLTSCHVPHLKLGQKAAEMMMGRLTDEPVPTCTDIGFRLIPGSTVRNSGT